MKDHMNNHAKYRVEFTVERKRGGAVRKAFEGDDVHKLIARVNKLDGYNIHVLLSSAPFTDDPDDTDGS